LATDEKPITGNDKVQKIQQIQ